MKYTSFNYKMAIIVLLVILGFGVFEWMSANLKIAAMLTAPLLFLVLFFSNTYEVKKGYLTVSTFGKTHQKIWLKDIVKVEVDKTFYGKKMAKVFYDQYNYISIPLGEKTNAFILELKNALPR
ncbi:MAG: hypothetical protein P8M17_11200 [Saprospiraceae bacterium]|nr:hypothetical protein [Saprospiraceae bacterium]MDG1432751.1 hypothetical protein [Saprospiraceae bacterium]MDG2419550.1 hypothetical protein [Saprospiraceae bacterium]